MAYSEGLGQRLEMEGRVNKNHKGIASAPHTYSILHKNGGVVVLECNTPGQLLRSSDHETRLSSYDRPKPTAFSDGWGGVWAFADIANIIGLVLMCVM